MSILDDKTLARYDPEIAEQFLKTVCSQNPSAGPSAPWNEPGPPDGGESQSEAEN